MPNVLITGGAGFIGSALVRYILTGDEFSGSVLNVDSLTYASNLRALESVASDSRYAFARNDITDLDAMRSLFRDFGPDIVMHLAAETHVDRSIEAPFEFVNTNVLGTCNLLQASLEFAGKKSSFRFVHVSTDEVYGSMAEGVSAIEGDTYRPNSPYSASKAASDHMARAWRVTYGLPVITTNCTNNYGPFQFPEKLIPVVILNALAGRSLPVYGDGGNVRDWLYVEDHVEAIWLAANRGAPGSSYNVSGNSERTNLEVVQAICRILDEKMPRADGLSYGAQITFVEDRPGHDRRYALDSTKLQRELGWAPRVSFEEGLRRTIDWYVENAASLARSTGAAYERRRGIVR